MRQYYYTVALKYHHVQFHDAITFTHVPKVLHVNTFLSQNLPYALSLTLSTVQKTINSHSTLHGSSYSCHASVTTLNLQYSLIISCYKQLGHSHSPKMHYFQLVIELYVPRNYAEGFAPWCSSFYGVSLCHSTHRDLRNTKEEQDMKLSHLIKEKFVPRVRRVTQVSLSLSLSPPPLPILFLLLFPPFLLSL